MQMKYRTETAEIKANVHVENQNLCLLVNDALVHVLNGKDIKVPKTFIIPNDAVITLKEDQRRIYINDLDDLIKLENKDEFTIKLSIEIPILPVSIPRFIRDSLVKISVVPYFSCNCWINDSPRTITIYTKERFERNFEQREIFKEKIMESIPDGEYIRIPTFCPYFGNCISNLPDISYISNDGKQVTEFDIDATERRRATI